MLSKYLRAFNLIILPIILSGTFAFGQVSSNAETKNQIQANITYCQLPAFHFWRNGNLFYSFKVSANGETTDIKNLRSDNINEEKVKSCISKWRINGVPENASFVVYFEWKYGKGWVEQRIGALNFKNTIKIEGSDYDYPNQNIERQTAINYCNFDVSKELNKTNQTLLYSFNVNNNGEIIKIKKIKDNYLGVEKVKSCLADWAILGFPKQKNFTLSFKFERNKGLTEQTISSKKISQTIEKNNF